ncbi:DUF4153 domain-containing protein [Yinghuangia soli]|uniref:DUF4173 domain-containing protein n=1 Tax=Yinghuangia soli TaxID=2908204 RepID=A0AA41Q1F1_9ACTN|nr:DUF4173 domain-containing protein [Yinghuangia soli]MCF2529011.1 DUF4173 domain-containing protein [Yinghuangia soli]
MTAPVDLLGPGTGADGRGGSGIPGVPIPVAVPVAALAAGVWAAFTFTSALGANLLIAALLAAVGAAAARRARGGRLHGWGAVWAAAALGFAALPLFRDDSWLHPFTTVAAFGFGTLALTGPRGWRGMLARPFVLPGAVRAGWQWAADGLVRRVPQRTAAGSLAVAFGLSAAVLLLFGGLFAAADAVVGSWLDDAADAAEAVDPMAHTGRWILGAVAASVALGAACLAARPHRPEPEPRSLRVPKAVEWALPLLVLDLVFAVFVFVQIAVVVFDGYHDVLADQGMNYAEYARQGFFTLLVVTALTLAVAAAASRFGPARGAPGRRLFETLLGTLCVLALAVVVSALHRLQLYVDYSGLTRLRICAATLELWLGVLLVLILATGPWARAARRLPRLAGASGAAILLTLGALSPDALIARVGVERQRESGVVDVRDIEGLGADAVPWLDKLPEPQRSCLLRPIARDLAAAEPWYATNLARGRARDLLAERPPLAGPACESREYRGDSSR